MTNILFSVDSNVEMVQCLLLHEKVDASARGNEALQKATSAEIIDMLVQNCKVQEKINEHMS